MKHTKSIVTIISLSALSQLAAQQTLPTVVVSDSAIESKSHDQVTEEDIENAQASDLNDLFQKTPSVTVNGGRAQAQQIFINGMESTLSNVTIDGASQGNLFHHSGSVFVEPELLKRVDVFAGAGNALQGLGALNGSLRFETKNAFDFLPENQQFASLSKGIYYSNGEGYRLSQSFAARIGNHWALLVAGGYTDRDEYEDGNGDTVDLTDYTSENYLLKLSGRFDGGHSLDFGYEHVLSETVAFDRLNISEDFLNMTGRPPGILQRNELTRDTFSLKYGYLPEANDFIDFSTNLAFSTQEFSRLTSGDQVELETFDLGIRNTSTFNARFNATYGFDFRSIDSKVANQGSEDETALGFYLQTDWRPHELVGLSLGGRYDQYDFDDLDGNNFDSSEFSPNAALTLYPTDAFSLTAGYAEAYRGVGIREAFLPGARPLGIDGEDAETFKLSANYECNGFFFSGSYFDQSIDNYLYPIASGRGGPNGSFGDIKNEGYELRVGYRKGGFSTSLAVTDSDPEVDGYDYPDDIGMVVAGRRWIADVSYSHAGSGVTVGANIEHREEVDEVPLAGPFPAVAAKGSYTLVNAFLRWDVQQVEGLTLSLNVDNLFDEYYQDHTIYTGSGLASPGREVRLGASYNF